MLSITEQILDYRIKEVDSTSTLTPEFGYKMVPMPSGKSTEDGSTSLFIMFIGSAFGQIPMIPVLLYSILKDPNEEKINEMTQTMGLKMKSKVAVFIFMLTIFMCILSAPVLIIMRLVFF